MAGFECLRRYFSVSDKSNLEATNREIAALKKESDKVKTNLERQVEEVTRFNNQLSQENKQLEDRNYDLIAENKLIQAELKNSLKQQNELEKKLKNQQVKSNKTYFLRIPVLGGPGRACPMRFVIRTKN